MAPPAIKARPIHKLDEGTQLRLSLLLFVFIFFLHEELILINEV
jgi:hypothetical protein